MEGPVGQQAFLRIQSTARGVSRHAGKAKPGQKIGKVLGSPSKHEEAAKNPKSGDNSSGTESDDEIDDLVPLEV